MMSLMNECLTVSSTFTINISSIIETTSVSLGFSIFYSNFSSF